MCGIIGYTGPRVARDVVVAGLRRMEYRGYDSAGVAVVADGAISYRKKAGKITNLVADLEANPLPDSGLGIGHTRWATHGGPTDGNAHPHVSTGDRVALIHNGIIENFAVLRAELEAEGVVFILGDRHRGRSPAARPRGERRRRPRRRHARGLQPPRGCVHPRRRGRAEPHRLVAARRNSPLVVGVGDGENFVASDVSAFIEFTRFAIELGQDQVVDVTADSIVVTDFAGNPADTHPFEVTWDLSAAEKSGYDWFMRKEIYEQPRAVADTLLGRYNPDGSLKLDELHIPEAELRLVDKIVIVACGTAYYAGLVAKYAIEHWTRIACEVEIASEFRYRDPIITRSTLVVTLSQSGETADTLMAIRHAREQHAKVIAICNTNGATIPRESDAVIYTHAGPEIGVASTKGFLTQVAACYLLGLYLAQVRGTMYDDEIHAVMAELASTPPLIQKVLDELDPIKDLAKRFVDEKSVLFLGRHVGYPVALEGALKLKEIAYLHAEGFPAGELKHGPIALVEEGIPIFIIVPAAGPRPAARQGGLQHPGGARPRCAHHRAGGGGRHTRWSPTPTCCSGCRRSPPCCSRWWPPSRCRCSPASWRR